MGRTAAAMAGLLAWQGLLVAAEKGQTVLARNYADGSGRVWVQNAVEAAIPKLQEASCRRLFEDFSDRDGIPLERKLHDLGVTPEEYLTRWIWFMEGSHQPQCRDRNIVAFTEAGARVVYVCSSRIAANHLVDGDTIVIHEMLHSLGLGENPPSAKEITERVHARCRP
jgi:hypothetical protein